MTLIDSLWRRSLYFFSNPQLLNLKHAGAEEGRNEGGRGNTLTFNMWEGKWLCTSSISTIFPFHWGKVLFHSCHFRSFISWGQPRLAVPSPHQHSYQWKWRQHSLQLGGRGGWRRSVTWFSEGIYNKVALTVGLKTFTQVYISASAAAIQTHHATQ